MKGRDFPDTVWEIRMPGEGVRRGESADAVCAFRFATHGGCVPTPFAAKYQTALPTEDELRAEVEGPRRALVARATEASAGDDMPR